LEFLPSKSGRPHRTDVERKDRHIAGHGAEAGYRNGDLTCQLGIWTKNDGRGRSFNSNTEFLLPNGAAFAPDGSWVAKDRLAVFSKEQKRKFLPLCPDFVVELTSPSDRLKDVQSKMAEWMESGAALAWLIDPDNLTVHVYRGARRVVKSWLIFVRWREKVQLPDSACSLRIYGLGFSACVLFAIAAVSGEPESSDLKSLYDAHKWSELRDAIQHEKAPALYRGAVGYAFNNFHHAETNFRSAIHSAPRSEEAYEAYEGLSHLYLEYGLYRRLISTMEERWAAFPHKSEEQNERNAMAGFRGLPDQITSKLRPSTLHHDENTFSPVSIDGKPAKYFFDTGAWGNCMSESEAKRFGLAVHDAGGIMGTATGVNAGFRIAVASELTAGNIHLRNVSFAILPDDQEPWSVLPEGRRGLLRMPVLLAFRMLRWTRSGTIEIEGNGRSKDVRASNLYFDNDHLFLVTDVLGRKVHGALDTGAETTDLEEAFAKEFGDLLRESGKMGFTEVRGVGHAESFDSITLPEVMLRIGAVDTILRPAHVLLKQLGPKGSIGAVGMDLLKQSRAFRIDLGAMTLELEP
jgi:predicted aspartyl protease